jgi:hypothetical protein
VFYRKIELALGQTYRKYKHYRRFANAMHSPRQVQFDKLMQIVRANEKTVFGKKHNFDKIQSIEDFQRYVPPGTYEDHLPYIESSMDGRRGQLTDEDPVMFATTSGTTGKPKYIPITPSHLKDYAHAFQIHNYSIIRDYPKAALGRFLIFASNDTEGFTSAGIPYGAVSGMLRRRQPAVLEKYFCLPHVISQIKDVEVKYYMMLRLALCQNVTALMACNPSSLLLLGDQMQEHAQDLIADIFDGTVRKSYSPPRELMEQLEPYIVFDRKRARELELLLNKDGKLLPKNVWANIGIISCWKGGPMPFYLEKLPEYYGNVPIRDFGYMASEGRGTIPLGNEGANGVIAITSHFFEFVAEEDIEHAMPRFFTVDQLQLNKRYYIHFTTAAGLYRYNINDLIEVVGFSHNTPLIRFVQKGMGVSSITGEKLTEEQVHIALSYAVRQLHLTEIDHFTFAIELGTPPRYACYAELKKDLHLPDSVMEEFLRIFELSLQMQNIEYKDKRLSKRLGSPVLQIVPPGTFTKLRQKRVSEGAPEAQVKIPLLNSGYDFRETLATLSDLSHSLIVN